MHNIEKETSNSNISISDIHDASIQNEYRSKVILRCVV